MAALDESKTFQLSLVLSLLFLVSFNLPHLQDEPLGHHGWRQADGLIVGRNYCDEAAEFLSPRLDVRGDQSGITGMEFPALNWVYGRFRCWGFSEIAAARALSLFFGVVLVLSLGLLARRFLGSRVAAAAVVITTGSPLVLFFSQSVQPDVPALACVIAAFCCFCAAVLNPDNSAKQRISRLWLLACVVLAALGLLLKLPVAIYGLPMACVAFAALKKMSAGSKLELALALLCALAPSFFWYSHAKDLQVRYGSSYFFLGANIHALINDWTSFAFYSRAFNHLIDVYVFFPFLIIGAGAVFALRRSLPLWTHVLLIAIVFYYFAIGYSASHHDYYGLVAVPWLAIVAAAGISGIASTVKLRWNLTLLIVALLAGTHGYIRTQNWYVQTVVQERYRQSAQNALDKIDIGEKIIVFSGADPRFFWLLNRKGWMGDANACAANLAENQSAWVVVDVAKTVEDGAKLRECFSLAERRLVLESPELTLLAPRLAP